MMPVTVWMRPFGQTSRLGACRLGAVVSCRVVRRAAFAAGAARSRFLPGRVAPSEP